MGSIVRHFRVGSRRTTLSVVLLFVASRLLVGSITAAGAEVVDEVHYTFIGPTSVAFDW